MKIVTFETPRIIYCYSTCYVTYKKIHFQVFASLGGLSLIAQHLPMTTFELLHPDTGTSGIKNSPMAHQVTSAMPFMQPGSHWGAVQPGHWGGMPPSVMPMLMAAEEEDIFGVSVSPLE